LLDGQYHGHAVLLLGTREVGHFLDMGVPNHATEAVIIGIGNQHHAAPFVTP
jgi:hypothetical protein